MIWNTKPGLTKLKTCLFRSYANDLTPRQTKKVFAPNPAKKPFAKKIRKKVVPVEEGPRINDVGIQMLSRNLHKQLFTGNVYGKITSATLDQYKSELKNHGMVKNDGQELVPDVDFKIPPLQGRDLIEHFEKIGREQAGPYQNLVEELLTSIPPIPTEWLLQPGWIKYECDKEPTPVPYPEDGALIFDVEVCMAVGKAPTLATAVSKNAWYGWVSPLVLEGSSKPVKMHQYSLDSLIPLESHQGQRYSKINKESLSEPRIIIGHNVSYDRLRIKEQYWLQRTALRFLDTMSLHICVSGLTSYQRAVLKSGEELAEDAEWKTCSSLNSLSEVHKLYCGTEISKETRNVFVEGSLKDVLNNFQQVMSYCANDVKATYDVLKHLFPLFLERFPHPVTFAGMLELSTAYLPITSNWNRYIEDSEETFEDMQTESKFILARKADHTCQLLHDDQYKDDLWMWDQDWTVQALKLLKKMRKIKAEETNITDTKNNEDEEEIDPLELKFDYLKSTRDFLPAKRPLLPGYPQWYRKLCTKPDSDKWVPGPTSISTSMQVTPKLLGLTWEGYPLHFIREKGWGFLLPCTQTVEEIETNIPIEKLLARCPVCTQKPLEATEIDRRMDKEVQEVLGKREYYDRLKEQPGSYRGAGVWCDTILDNCVWFYKLPHKDGKSHRVGNPLARDFLTKFSENVLAGDTDVAERVLLIARMLSYWRNNRDRIMEQMVVWLNEMDLPNKLRGDTIKYGAILPQVVVCGTLTRRAVEPTWMTASNAHSERIGSELRAMIQAPRGYNIVGADVDSQELWIASVLGDAHLGKIHGVTPFGWMTLSGNKADGTDMHSVTAKAVGISREHAKVLNYARIYGAGQNFAEQLLKQFNPAMSEEEARRKASKMFTFTKGKREYRLKPEFLDQLDNKPYSRWEAQKIVKLYNKPIAEIFYPPKWIKGTESAMFNCLEEIANNLEPTTPFLNCRLSRALEPKAMPGDRFLPTRVNWVVQSGAVDFLHLMLTNMRWIMGDKIRFCLSFHDEVRYLVPNEYKYQTALAMHVTNLFTRSFCSLKLGLNDLPQSVAFFSSAEVDTVLRKESKQDCKTPSNPHGLEKGYGISCGESLSIYEAIEKAGGGTEWWLGKKSNVKSNKKKTCPDGDTPR